jgi:hypothetical protein
MHLWHHVCFKSAHKANIQLQWVLHSQDNLHSGPYKPFSLASSDITALLPCDEEEFKAAQVPQSRAALEGTPPAMQNPQLTTLRPRSLFATLIQTHHLWGIIARRAVSNEKSSRPGNDNSEYQRMASSLRRFEDNLFGDHRFGIKSLKGHRQDNEDLVNLQIPFITFLWLLTVSAYRHSWVAPLVFVSVI